MLNPGAAVPLYYQLKELLREKIVSGEWPPGTQIPSEAQLGSTHGISRITVRQAIHDLATEGWLDRRRGKGTFVRSSKPEIGLSPLFMLQQIAAFQGPPEHESLRTRTIVAPPTVSASLRVEVRERVFEVVRVRIVDSEPTAFEVGYLPRRILRRLPTRIEIRRKYFYDILRECAGIEPARTRVLLELVLLGKEEARVLKAPPGSPALRLERLTVSAAGQPVLLTRNIMAGDRCRYAFELEVPKIEWTTGWSQLAPKTSQPAMRVGTKGVSV